VKVLLFIFLLSSFAVASHAQSGRTQQKKVTRVKKPQLHSDTDTVGVVNDQVITYADFKSLLAARVRAQIEQSHDSVVTDSEYSGMVDSAWNASVRYILMQQEIAKRKLDVSEIEAKNYILANPPDFIRQQFMDSSGRFDSARWVYSAKDKRNDDVMAPLVRSAQIQLETNNFITVIVGDAASESEKEKRYAAWERHALQKARIVDHRLKFGFY
jgi:hypothetical protein